MTVSEALEIISSEFYLTNHWHPEQILSAKPMTKEEYKKSAKLRAETFDKEVVSIAPHVNRIWIEYGEE